MSSPDAWYWPLTGRVFTEDEEFDRRRKWVNTSNPHSFPHKAGLKKQEDIEEIEPLFSAETISQKLMDIITDEEGMVEVDNRNHHQEIEEFVEDLKQKGGEE